MTENALAKKMKLKPGQRAALIHAPEGYVDSLRPLPEHVDLAEQRQTFPLRHGSNALDND